MTTTTTAPPAPPPSTPQRLLSLDAFRGLVIVLMFLVNVAGTDKAFPTWFPHRGYNNGLHGIGLADYVFPWFLFIVGAAIPFSMASGRGKDQPPLKKLLAAFRRGLTIYLLGSLLWCATIAYAPDTPNRLHKPIDASVLLHWDILPLIGLGYFLAVALWLLPRWAPATFIALVLFAKWLCLTQIPHPDLGTVVWTNTDSIDRLIRAHLGWLGTLLTQGLPAAATVLLGSFAGDILRRTRTTDGSLAPSGPNRLLILGTLAVAASYALHRWNLPYSKDFFTSSYILVSAGTGMILLAAAAWIIDLRKLTTLTFLRVYGTNALFAYLLAEFLWKMALTRWYATTPADSPAWLITAWKAWLQAPLGPTLGSWAHVATYILAYWLLCLALYRKKIFVKV